MVTAIPSLRFIKSAAAERGIDLNATAHKCGAFIRVRNFHDASDLLASVLGYAAGDVSFKDAAAAFSAAGKRISRSALQRCLERSESWLAALIDAMLNEGRTPAPDKGRRLCAIDSSSVSGPASDGTDWRVHATCDPCTGAIVSLKVTGKRVGESVSHHPVDSDWCALLDRGYPTSNNLVTLTDSGARFIVRHVPQNLRLSDDAGERLDIGKVARSTKVDAPTSMTVTMPVRGKKSERPDRDNPPRSIRLRLVVVRLKEGDLLWYLTNLPDSVSPDQISGAYRLRWQIELLFKRLKSIAGIDRLKSRDGPTAQAWLLAKLLLCVLADALARRQARAARDAARESEWSRFRAAWKAVCHILIGDAFLLLCEDATAAERLLNSRRKRRRQRVSAGIKAALNLRLSA